ncbi:MAG: glutamate 5-kinase [Candidatus Lokiarchaeota archaeon]|nr:glutamate 5-kinase [Candidatus Lokiarchaeota archaeon]
MRDLFSINKMSTIVIKVGTNLLTDGRDIIYHEIIDKLVRQIAVLIKEQNKKVILVSSGAIGCGMKIRRIKERPKKMEKLQALAAIGQPYLMGLYREAFNQYDIDIGQILMTKDDSKDSTRRDHLRNTIKTLLNLGVLPIINENDTVAVEEIAFGDNDTLTALVALLLYSDIVIFLSTVDGLCTSNPDENETFEVIPQVEKITPEIEILAQDCESRLSAGGMESKLKAAQKLTNVSIPIIIANGSKDNVILDILLGKEIGTLFLPEK